MKKETSKTYKIKELTEKLGVSRRTIHYYLARHLLPPSEGEGLGTLYSDEHYYRILLIKQWQKEFLPLDEIRKRISCLTLEEVKAHLQGKSIAPKNTYSEPNKILGTTWQKIPLSNDLELFFKVENPIAVAKANAIMDWLFKYEKEG